MNILFKPAAVGDLETLTALMQEYYALDGLEFDRERALNALRQLIGDGDLGGIWLIADGPETIGYIVMTICFSLEFGGRFGLLDELYVRETYRGRGIGSRGLEMAEEFCRSRDIRAIRLEVEHENEGAQRLYRRSGFVPHGRYLMTKWLRH